jgi:hypothetical protein
MKTAVLLLSLFLCAVSAEADLKTWLLWLHGAPPRPTPGPPDAKAAAVSFGPGVASDPQILEFMQTFAEAMRVHDGKALKPRLSDKYAIENLPGGHDAADLFMQGMVQIKAPEEIVITSVAREGDVRVATTEFRSADKTKTRIFKFDPAGKLLSSDLFKLEIH